MKELLKLWTEAERPIDYLVAFWAYLLLSMFCIGSVQILYALISGDVNLEHASFGIFDTLG